MEVGDESFDNFKIFELSKVNSLQSIWFGYECFEYADKSILKGEREKWW